MAARVILGALLLTFVVSPRAHVIQQTSRPTEPIFRFESDRFWLNLHHFLYVLGRAESRMPDASRRAVSDAPADQARGMASLSTEERDAWQEAVRFYAANVSRNDIVFHRPSVEATNALAVLDGGKVPADGVLAPLAAELNRAAPAYRKAWWPAHRAANERWVSAANALVETHGRAVLDFITRAYGLPWRAGGYPVRVSGYTNWAGAYSTHGDLLVVSSLDAGNTGLSALETTFHEAMHQWDEEVEQLLQQQARQLSVRVPGWLSHAIVFYTAGAAVRSAVPGHTPYADANGIWERSGRPFKTPLDEAWGPYLRGKGTRDEALAELLRTTATRK